MTGAVVLLVGLKVSGESLNLLGENGDLNFAGSRITVVTLIFVTDGGFVELHCFYLSFLVRFLVFYGHSATGKLYTPPMLHHGAKAASKERSARGRDKPPKTVAGLAHILPKLPKIHKRPMRN